MQMAWSYDPRAAQRDETIESDVCGRIRTFGPFRVGTFEYIDKPGGFTFIQLRGTTLGFSWNW